MFNEVPLPSLPAHIVIKNNAPLGYHGRIVGFCAIKVVVTHLLVLLFRTVIVPACPDNRLEIAKMPREEHLERRHVIQEETHKHHRIKVPCRHILIEHQQIVAEIEVGFLRVFVRQRARPQVIHHGLRHAHQSEAPHLKPPA